MRIQVIFGILWIFTQSAMALLFQDPVVCRFTARNQCDVALGQRLHLQMPLEDEFDLNFRDETSSTHQILRYRTTQMNPLLPGWQFVNETKAMILSSVERSNSGTYNLLIIDADGNIKGKYNLQLITEAEVSSVKVSYSCISPGVMKIDCSADGDNLRFSWTSDSNTLFQVENGKSALILDQDYNGNATCLVENNVSRETETTELHPCTGLLFQDPVVCRFTQRNQCYVALGQQLHLKMPLEETLYLQFNSETSGARRILRYRKADRNPPKPLPRWQFVKDNKAMILSSAERSDSGKYTLSTFDAKGTTRGEYNLQVIIEAEVSSVKVSYSCISPGVTKVDCSADGDNLRFSWTYTLSELENRKHTLILDQNYHGNVTCLVENNVSRETLTTELYPCTVTSSTQCNNDESVSSSIFWMFLNSWTCEFPP
ncbi:uncharacterized protein LOC132869168 isoform X2 [Neoarius graeffei]|uniref:uncharacterized protein LOC132869168 isoform X2 n=1 Tax=Neoarius graeffei TaxID=443677 RepID=UPI00298D3258|nr:uncharacterized protein LOC132869168 isoform X2 [Neoarius graeffei]